jgi:TatD DNase family protein
VIWRNILQYNLIDFHVHIDLYPKFKEVAQECENKKIYTLAVTTTPKAWVGNNTAYQGMKYVKPALGIHPQLVKNISQVDMELFYSLIPSAKYLGEVGLDKSKEFIHSFSKQVEIFKETLKLASESNVQLLSIHSKNATSEVLEIIRKHNKPLNYIMHWFSGNKQELDEAINLGCWFSVGEGMLNNEKGIENIKNMQVTKILTETDGPFVRFNNSNIFPWNVYSSIQKISNLFGVSEKDTQEQIYKNLKEVLK